MTLRLLSALLLSALIADAAPLHDGLVALYDFASPDSDTVHDRSGVAPPLNLKISNPKSVHRTPGSLEIRGQTIIRSDKPAKKIIDAVRRSGELTIEAWIKPTKTDQTGPARIITLSRNGSERNTTLGQDGDRYDARLRTTSTSNNGIPSVSSKPQSLHNKLTHVVYSRDRSGRTQIFIDGKSVTASKVAGKLDNWDHNYTLALGNEHSNDRLWLGTYHRVAIYARALRQPHVAANFEAGANTSVDPALIAASKPNPDAEFFESKIAPILARNCLECHDASNRKGKLNLAHRSSALAGGKNGKPIVPGKSHESLLWESIESDEMPDDRPPLSDNEKRLVKQWIDSGAHWSLNEIDRLLFANAHDDGQIWVRRLTVPEYIETVRATTGVDIDTEARKILPPDLRADGFSNTAYNLNVDLKHIESYARLASATVARMDIKKFADRFSKNRKFTDNDMGKLIEKIGAWLLRGPLDNREIITYRGISTTVASAGGSDDEAVAFIVEAMLQSPRFIYQIENQRGDGTPWPVSDHELASRLSYMIWGGPPDRQLLGAATDGTLDISAQVARMLDDPRARQHSSRFASEWLNLGRLGNLNPDQHRFPSWDPALAADMRDETLAFFNEIAWKQKRHLGDLFNASFTYATPRLAKHYGLRPVSEKTGRYDLSSVPARGGLMTQGSILTVGGDEASMVTRGLFVLHDVLRGVVSDPPPGLDTTPVPSKPGLSQRKIAEQRLADRSCSACHTAFEPLAFGLEKYDGIGAHHEIDEHGNKLREDGNVVIPGADKPIPYQTTGQLLDIIASSDRVHETITWKLAQFSLGRPLGARDAKVLKKVHSTAKDNGFTYPALITALATSDLVTKSRTEPDS